MAVAMLYMKFFMQPKLEANLAKQLEILEQQRLAEIRANQTDFSAFGDGELEVGFQIRPLCAILMVKTALSTLHRFFTNMTSYEQGHCRPGRWSFLPFERHVQSRNPR